MAGKNRKEPGFSPEPSASAWLCRLSNVRQRSISTAVAQIVTQRRIIIPRFHPLVG
jgi:hypothetical protein